MTRQQFVIILRPEPGVTDPALELRRLLKKALRNYRLRCVDIREIHEQDQHHEKNT